MQRLALIVAVLAVAWVVCWAKQPTRPEFLRIEAKRLKCYCSINAPAAEAAHLECERYGRQWQENGVFHRAGPRG